MIWMLLFFLCSHYGTNSSLEAGTVKCKAMYERPMRHIPLSLLANFI